MSLIRYNRNMPQPSPTSYTAFLHELVGVRVLYVRGGFGTGKTALAFQIAHDLVKNHGFTNIVSNVSSVWTDRLPIPLNDGFLNSVFIIDEAGLFIRNKNDAEDFMAFLRKFNIVCIFPSAVPAFKLPYVMTIKRIGTTLWNVPIWELWYSDDRYTMRKSFRDVYGIYKTREIVTSGSEMSAFLKQTTRRVEDNQRRFLAGETDQEFITDEDAHTRVFAIDNWLGQYSLKNPTQASHPYFNPDLKFSSLSVRDILQPIVMSILAIIFLLLYIQGSYPFK